MGYKVRVLDRLNPLAHSFGEVRELYTGDDHQDVNIAYVRISDDHLHHHNTATEFYYVIGGRGRIQLDDKEEPLFPGVCIMIEPGTKHRAIADGEYLELLVISSPPYNKDDEFPD